MYIDSSKREPEPEQNRGVVQKEVERNADPSWRSALAADVIYFYKCVINCS